jgi:hypothetical protein
MKSWKMLVWIKVLFIAMWVGWIPCGSIAIRGMSKVLPEDKMETSLIVLFIAWAGTWATAFLMWRSFKCPSCSKKFFRREKELIAWRTLLGNTCVNCGAVEGLGIEKNLQERAAKATAEQGGSSDGDKPPI